MKKIFAILAITFMGQLAFAQQASSTEAGKSKSERKEFHKRGKHRKAAMMKQLNLSEEQKAKLKEMKAAHKERAQAIKNDSKLSDEQKKEQLKALKGERKKNMEAVLNDEQKAQMKEMKAKMKAEKKHHKKMKSDKTGEATTTGS